MQCACMRAFTAASVLARVQSALTLLVPRVLADDHDTTVPANHLALVADLLDAGLDFHLSSFLMQVQDHL